MKILHLFRQRPDDATRQLAAAVGRDRQASEVPLYDPPVDYDRLLKLILTHDQVITWW
jgi:hypothetical protein